MESLFHYVATPTRCGYLPDRHWSLEYELVGELTKAEYLALMLAGWRRFGAMLFRPACQACTACRALRVPAAAFRPDRSQRRCRKAQRRAPSTVRIGTPSVTRAKLALYDRYHAFQSRPEGLAAAPRRGRGQLRPTRSSISPSRSRSGVTTSAGGWSASATSIRCRPWLAIPRLGGLSAIYFFYDPDERGRSLGTWNVLCLLDEAFRRSLPYVYLGYYVEGCPSMSYKPPLPPQPAPRRRRGVAGLPGMSRRAVSGE